MSIEQFLAELAKSHDLGKNIVHQRKIPAKASKYADIPGTLDDRFKEALMQKGLDQLYTHQSEAIQYAINGDNVIVATPTASGKTICYMAPIISQMLTDPDSTAIFMFPLKALEHDQLKAFRELTSGFMDGISAEIFDGDTKQHKRRKIMADPPRAIFTNPDMLHLSIMPYHGKWEKFLKRLKYVVVDETHSYRGVFGSNMAQVLRRLNRICAYYGAKPQYIASSATINNPGQLAEDLTGMPFTVVEESGAPRPGGNFIVYNTEASPYADASKLFRASIKAGLKTIAFTKARKITELIYTWTAQADPDLAGRVSCYRAGFLPEERRQIEGDLFSGQLDGVVSTSALEMGVDIGGLDVCILVGYPGTIVNTWQRGGRVGRGDREFLIALITQPDALDQYFVKHPDELFTREFEAAIVDPGNEPILKNHLVCATAEIPLTEGDDWFPPDKHEKVLGELIKERRLALSGDGSKWLCPRQYPHRDTPIRSVGESYTIFGQDGKTVIGVISGSKVFGECHEGAVYLHRGQQYLITNLDLEKRAINAKSMDERYYTRPRSNKETDILEELQSKTVNGFTIKIGKLKVSEQITGYEKRSIFGQETLGVYELESPVTEFETVGFWVEIEDAVKEDIENRGLGFMGGIHALEHGVIALFPLFALCDRDDIGGISYAIYPAFGKSAIFFYDGYPGGLGLCESGYEKIEDLWDAALKLVSDCDCEVGCPSCIHSPKCGSGNKPLDKGAAQMVLEYLCGKKELAKISKTKKPKVKIIESTKPKVDKDSAAYYNPAPRKRIVFFDLETKKSAEQVGGWGNTHMMELAVGVLYDSIDKKYTRYWEGDVKALVNAILEADLVVGFNHVKFDYSVLSGYTDIDLVREAKSFDILTDIKNRLNFRLSLGHIAEATLGKPKTADGLTSLQWWADGKHEQVAVYCQVDVEITKELFEYGLENQKLLYKLKNGELAQLPLDWDFETIIAEAAKPKDIKKRKIRF